MKLSGRGAVRKTSGTRLESLRVVEAVENRFLNIHFAHFAHAMRISVSGVKKSSQQGTASEMARQLLVLAGDVTRLAANSHCRGDRFRGRHGGRGRGYSPIQPVPSMTPRGAIWCCSLSLAATNDTARCHLVLFVVASDNGGLPCMARRLYSVRPLGRSVALNREAP